MAENKLTVAAAQFRVTGDLDTNFRRMAFWMKKAAEKGAELVHFPETALTGYYRVHLKDVRAIDRRLLELRNRELRRLAAGLKLWLAYGSTHFPEGLAKPYNSVYLVRPDGVEEGRYDKVFLTDTDQRCYSPGNRLVIARIKDFRVGLLVCFDMRFPELFRRYLDSGVNLLLISSYQSGGERAPHMRSVAPSTLITRAAENGIYLSASNTCEKPSWHDSMIVNFNGVVLAKAARHKPSLALATLDAGDSEPFTDFIRRTARHSLRYRHPVLGQDLAPLKKGP